jgi:hypothetical protein
MSSRDFFIFFCFDSAASACFTISIGSCSMLLGASSSSLCLLAADGAQAFDLFL